MSPTAVDKTAGKRYGYVPDYSVWIEGIPVLIVEAKSPDIAIEAGLREAHLYAGEINKRYPPGVNPIAYVLATNGIQLSLAAWDNESDAFTINSIDAQPGSSALDALRGLIGAHALEAHADKLRVHFSNREFYRTAAFMGGQAKLDQQLGVNEFAESLFPLVTRYFGSNADDDTEEIIERAYVSTNEIGTYDSVLETYLRDRTRDIAGSQIQAITTTKTSATGISTELQKFSQSPKFYSRVQLIIGAVGSGKTTFVKRFYKKLLSKDISDRTNWSFIDFNVASPNFSELNSWIADRFITSFGSLNNLDLYELEILERIFSVEINNFNKGPAKNLAVTAPSIYDEKYFELIESLKADPVKFASAICRHFGGDKALGLVVVFDNVDKRSRDEQLQIFEAAQWFKDLSKSLVLVNLRDSTFEAHRDEPPLDAFINAINFYIQPPRFAQVIRKRLELLLERLSGDVTGFQEYSTETGLKIRYPASRLGEFMMSIYVSLFQRRVAFAPAIEALVAKDVRRALGMFGDILVSPHIPTSQITGAAITAGANTIQERRILRSLMRGRYRYFNGKSAYVKNILSIEGESNRPSNFLMPDIMEFLIRNRKARIDFAQEGYALTSTILNRMSQLGYDEDDAYAALSRLVQWGLIEPESLIVESLKPDDPVRMHASGFIHMRFFVQRSEYLIGITTDMEFGSRSAAEDIGNIWSGGEGSYDLTLASKARLLEKLQAYLQFEYTRRCRRHAFYEELGYGGRSIVAAATEAMKDLREVNERFGRG